MKALIIFFYSLLVIASSGGRGNTLGDDDRVIDISTDTMIIKNLGLNLEDFRIGGSKYLPVLNKFVLKTSSRKLLVSDMKNVQLYSDIKLEIDEELDNLKFENSEATKEEIINNLDKEKINPFIKLDF